MDAALRVESELIATFARIESAACPPSLASAMRYAVFPGGARIRPKLCIAVAIANGEDCAGISDIAATSIELLHCASLVHDDLPCFDDAELRRGRASVHKAYGERLAVLAGDGLIVLAFQALARVAERAPERLATLLSIVGRAVGAPCGVVAGQGWECESHVELADYQRAKTAELFAAATMAGAAAAGREYASWRALGERLGEAYQVADDLRDVAGDVSEIGKPVGKDAALGRPSAVAQLGVAGALHRLDCLVAEATESVPSCAGAAAIRALIAVEAARLMPKKLARRAA